MLVYIIALILIIKRVATTSVPIIKAQLYQNGCDGKPLEGETVRYRMLYEIARSSADPISTGVSFLIGVTFGMSIIFFMFVKRQTTDYKYLLSFTSFVLVFMMFMVCYLYLGHYDAIAYSAYPQRDEYMEAYIRLHKFVDTLQYYYKNNLDLPQQYKRLIEIVLDRISAQLHTKTKKEAVTYFTNQPPWKIVEYFSMARGTDSDIILEPLLCKNFYSHCTNDMLYSFVNSRYKDRLSNEYAYHTDLRSDTESNILTSLKSTKPNTEKTSPDFIKHIESLTTADLLQYIPWGINPPEQRSVLRNFENFSNSITIADKVYCNCSVKPSIAVFGNSKKKYETYELETLADSIKKLSNIGFADPTTQLNNHFWKILIFVLLSFGILTFSAFDRIYKTGKEIMLILIVIGIVSGLSFLSNMFIFA